MRPLAALAALLSASAIVLGAAGEAHAKCTRLSFSVNDYGKEGPTRDAKDLLDKHIVKWTAEKGIKSYTVGKKDVTCELFLNFIVFDEHTCKASATVCWGEGAPKAAPAAAGAAPADAGAAPAVVPKAPAAPAAKPPAAPAGKAKAAEHAQ